MKRVGSDIYVHWSAVSDLPEHLQETVRRAYAERGSSFDNDLGEPTVVRVHRDGSQVMFGWVDDWNLAHPGLIHSVGLEVLENIVRLRTFQSYDTSIPIYHRKDQFVLVTDPNYETYKALTDQEETAGLLGRPDIGYRHKWEDILKEAGFQIEGHTLSPL